MSEVKSCFRCEKAPRVNDWHCVDCRDFLTSDKKPGGSSGCAIASVFSALVVIMLVGYCSQKSPATAPQDMPPNQQGRTGYQAAAEKLGIDSGRYERDANSVGLQGGDALAADLIICREAGDCPEGVTPEEAHSFICSRTGDC